MPHSSPIVATIVVSLVFAFVLGFLVSRVLRFRHVVPSRNSHAALRNPRLEILQGNMHLILQCSK